MFVSVLSDCAHIIRRLYDGKDPQEVPNSGPAPAIIRFNDLATVTPLWEQVTAAIEADKEAVKVLGEWEGMGVWGVEGDWVCVGKGCWVGAAIEANKEAVSDAKAGRDVTAQLCLLMLYPSYSTII